MLDEPAEGALGDGRRLREAKVDRIVPRREAARVGPEAARAEDESLDARLNAVVPFEAVDEDVHERMGRERRGDARDRRGRWQHVGPAERENPREAAPHAGRQRHRMVVTASIAGVELRVHEVASGALREGAHEADKCRLRDERPVAVDE